MKFLLLLLSLSLSGAAFAQYPNLGPGPVTSSAVAVVATAGAANLTGVTTETNIASLRIPANSMGKNGTVFATCVWSFPNSANTKTLVARWSATQGAITGTLVGNSSSVTTTVSAQTGHILRNNNATNAQVTFGGTNNITPFTASTNANNTGAVDTTADAYININGVLALGTETLTVQHCYALIMKAP